MALEHISKRRCKNSSSVNFSHNSLTLCFNISLSKCGLAIQCNILGLLSPALEFIFTPHPSETSLGKLKIQNQEGDVKYHWLTIEWNIVIPLGSELLLIKLQNFSGWQLCWPHLELHLKFPVLFAVLCSHRVLPSFQCLTEAHFGALHLLSLDPCPGTLLAPVPA